MKLLIVVVTFVVVPIAFADDVVWQVAPPFSLMPGGSPPEGGQATKGPMPDDTQEQTQHQRADEQRADPVPSAGKRETHKAQDDGQNSQGKVDPQEPSPNLWRVLSAIGAIFVTLVGLIFVGIQTYMRYRADRAYLSVEKWEVWGEYHAEMEIIVLVTLVNNGRTPATLRGTISSRHLSAGPPPPFKRRSQPLDGNRRGMVVSAQGGECTVPLYFPAVSLAEQRQMKEQPMQYYVFAYIEYYDGFHCRQKVLSTAVSYSWGGAFFLVEGEDYHYST